MVHLFRRSFQKEINKIVQITDKFEGSYIGDAKLLLETMKWIRNLDPELPVLLTIGTNVSVNTSLAKSIPLCLNLTRQQQSSCIRCELSFAFQDPPRHRFLPGCYSRQTWSHCTDRRNETYISSECSPFPCYAYTVS